MQPYLIFSCIKFFINFACCKKIFLALLRRKWATYIFTVSGFLKYIIFGLLLSPVLIIKTNYSFAYYLTAHGRLYALYRLAYIDFYKLDMHLISSLFLLSIESVNFFYFCYNWNHKLETNNHFNVFSIFY